MNRAVKVLTEMLAYKVQDWMQGQEVIEEVQCKLQHLQKIAGAIEHFERKAATAFSDSQEPSILGFEYFYRKYELSKSCAEKLRKKFNIEASEIQL